MTSLVWYLLPLFFGFVGHAILSNSLAYDDKKIIKKSFKIAIIITCIYSVLFVLYFIKFGILNDD